MGIASKTLSDDYEADQLNPAWTKTADGKASHEKIKDVLKAMPEESSLRMRVAICEAVVDEVLEDMIDESDGEVNSEELMAAISPIVDKAVTLHLVPASLKNRVPHLVAKHLKRVDPRMALLQKAAFAVTDAMVTMSDDDTVVSEVLDDAPADTGFDIQEEVVEPSGDSVNIEGTVPTVVEQSMRMLAVSAVNTRKATALVSRTCAGVMLDETLSNLKNHLPEKFNAKYRLK